MLNACEITESVKGEETIQNYWFQGHNHHSCNQGEAVTGLPSSSFSQVLAFELVNGHSNTESSFWDHRYLPSQLIKHVYFIGSQNASC